MMQQIMLARDGHLAVQKTARVPCYLTVVQFDAHTDWPIVYIQ
jgi:hypothetical protein